MNSTPLSRRTFQPVRHSSAPVGTREAEIWRPMTKLQMGQALKAAARFDVLHKAKGERNGPLGHVGLEVYRALWSRVRFSDGRLDPSIMWLMKACGRSRSAIVSALRRLRSCGFLKWIRRLTYTGGPPGERGPQVQQATNAYALDLPADAGRLIAGSPIPDDELSRLRDRVAAIASFEREAFDHSPLGATFARWGEQLRSNASPPNTRNPSLRILSSGEQG